MLLEEVLAYDAAEAEPGQSLVAPPRELRPGRVAGLHWAADEGSRGEQGQEAREGGVEAEDDDREPGRELDRRAGQRRRELLQPQAAEEPAQQGGRDLRGGGR